MLLRKFTLDDAERLAFLLDDEEVSRWTSKIPFPYSVRDACNWINSMAERPERHPFAVELDGDIVAGISFWPSGDNETEVGYWVGRDYWGRGIGSRALALLMLRPEFPSQTKVVAKVVSGNTGSEKVLHKNGFEFAGACTLTRMGEPVDGRLFVRREKGEP